MKMNFKMILTDLDGTLLRDDKRVSEYTASVLRRARDAGLLLVIATARPPRTVLEFLNAVEADVIICHNGALAFVGGERVISKLIPTDTAREVLARIGNEFPEMRLSLEMDDILYANFDVHALWPNTNAVLSDFTGLPGTGAEKLIICAAEPRERERVLALLPSGLHGIPTVDGLIMVQRSDTSKWSTAQLVADRFGILPAEIAAFGDDHSDLEMLACSGAGVAVENAAAEIKKAAKYIALSNGQDGPAHWIEQNLLGAVSI